MNKKAFTLIELLAVIVILAIIALIAVPIILNIINNAKESSSLRNGEQYLDAVEQASARKNLDEDFNPNICEVQSDGNLMCDGEKLVVEVDGEKPSGGTIIIERGIIKEVEDLTYKDVVLETDEKGNLRIKDGTKTEEVYKDNSGANTPELSGMTPVLYKDNAWVIADTSKEWYDYSQYNWANAVILTDAGKGKSEGQALDLDTDVKAMLVWIPRYEYKIGEKEKEISVNFISGTGTSATDEYTIHPSFTFGEDELSGIWVGKFETSANKTSICYTSASDTNCNNANQDPYILPNVSSLRYQTMKNQFDTAKKFNTFLTNADSHMIKNSEWGAVAYLSQSKYGKYGNPAYQGTNKEIYQNKSSSYITGSSNGTPGQIATTNPQYTYDVELNGTGASTTGTIYGVYDMSGGAVESVMGNYSDTPNGLYVNFGEGSEEVIYSGFDATWFANNTKYYDKYTTTSCTDAECKGHALGETANWYGDNANFVSSSNPWFFRSGDYISNTGSGVFFFNGGYGASIYYESFRVTIAPLN